jgi:hypothetical protein
MEATPFSLRDKLTSLQASDRELACVYLFNLQEIPEDLLPLLVKQLTDTESKVVEAALNACTSASYVHAGQLLQMGILGIANGIL